MPIVLCQVLPELGEQNRSAEQIKQINALYLAAVKNDPQVIPLDTWTLFADATATPSPSEFPDLLHPNRIGYAKWAAASTRCSRRCDSPRPSRTRSRRKRASKACSTARDLNGLGLPADVRSRQGGREAWQAADPTPRRGPS